jgi:F-type H+-transporting ATPase subunit b
MNTLDLGALALQLLNFGVLVFILVRFAGPAMRKGLRNRHDQIRTGLEEAARRKADAETRHQQQCQRMATIEKEIAALGTDADAAREQALIFVAVADRVKRLQEETRFQIEHSRREVEERFRAEVTEAALRIAEELLRKSVSVSDEERLAQEFSDHIAAPEGAAAPPPGPSSVHRTGPVMEVAG